MAAEHVTMTRIIALLAVGQVVMMAASLSALLFLPVPEQNRESVSLLIGAVIAQSGNVIAYFFGRSDGERRKDQTIGAMADTMRASADNAPAGSITVRPPLAETVTVTPGVDAVA